MAEARPHPPSEQRLAEARRQGHVPRVRLLGVLAPWATALLGLWAFRERLADGLVSLTRSPLERVAQGQVAWTDALWAALRDQVLTPVAVVLVATWIVLVATSLFAQGPVFAFGMRTRRRFAPLSHDPSAPGLFALLVVLVTLLSLRATLRVTADGLVDVLVTWATWTLVALAACSLVDVALARARHFRSLWMTRREHLDELREAYGAPEARAMRARAQRERSTSS